MGSRGASDELRYSMSLPGGNQRSASRIQAPITAAIYVMNSLRSFSRSRDQTRPNVLEKHMSATRTCFTAGVTRRAGIKDRPTPAATRASVLSIWAVLYTTRILIPRETSALLASWNLSACSDNERFVMKISKRHAFSLREAMIFWNGQHIWLLEAWNEQVPANLPHSIVLSGA
jgi:hypothetical protein